ncbi:hypothetical protein PSACC_03580 [Paramicrosporidium saccamoebae]|uniref:CRAL-TRIO domain-containing protein n=1 Tax=Paramicrosporidium saccamoebae TaxID=1246581 RepID=A0A2H9TFP7_9FUNG|nr:hypothetical protein PSACC_03580 [Paramicrosporidium saccamoebae]
MDIPCEVSVPLPGTGSPEEPVVEMESVDTPPIKTRRSSSGPGCLHTINDKQKSTLFLLWNMLDAYFRHPYIKVSGEKLAELGQSFLETGNVGGKAAASEHPLYLELYRFAASDDLDTTLLRFLRARKWNVITAFTAIVECLIWRHEFGVDALMRAGESRIDQGSLESGKGFVWGEDRDGRLVVYMRGRLHDKNAQTLEESIDYAVHFLEMARSLRRHDEQLLTVVIDMQGAGLASFDLPLAQAMGRFVQGCYPEVMGVCLVMNAPWIFWGFWSIVKNLLDPVIVAKFAFIKPAELVDYIDPAQTPVDFGGRSSFRYHYFPDPKPVRAQIDEMALTALYRKGKTFAELNRQIHTNWDPSIVRSRNLVKAELRIGYYLLMKPVYPQTIYHRWGICREDGSMDWSLYKGPAKRHLHLGELEQLRSSAPP